MSKRNRIEGWIGAGLFVIYMGWTFGWKGGQDVDVTVSHALLSLGALFAGVALIRAYRRSGGEKHWLYYGIGMLSFFAAQIYCVIRLLYGEGDSGSFGIAETLRVIQYVFMAGALYEQNRKSWNPAFPYLFDILLLTTVSVSLYWQQMIRPAIAEHNLTEAMNVYNLFISSVNLVFFVFLLFFDRSRLSSITKYSLCAGFLLKTLGSSFNWLIVNDLGRYSSFDEIAHLCRFAGTMLIGFAAVYGSTRIGPAYSKADQPAERKRYIPLVLGGLLLVLLLASASPSDPVAIGCLIGVVFLIVRLFYGILETETVNRALRESNLTYRNWAENALVGVFIEQDGQLVYVNRHCEEIFGYKPGEMVGHTIVSHIAIADISRYMSEVGKLQDNIPTTRFGVTGVKRDQAVLYLELHLAKTYFQGKQSLSGTVIDITERKMSEQYLIRSEKLSVVGQLAAGVAHEIRNPLTALKGFTQLLHQNSDVNRQYYEIMLTELERINYIVGEFMVLSKPHNRQQLKEQDVHRILASIIPILESQAILHNVIIRVETCDGLPLVKCDENQIKQVLINLMKNAIESMPGGGTVTVRYEADVDRRGLIVYVEDQGMGIPPDLLARLGEPFLTTKEKGTGLGLMVCYKIIQAHEGTLSVHSLPGQGTAVKLVLPVR